MSKRAPKDALLAPWVGWGIQGKDELAAIAMKVVAVAAWLEHAKAMVVVKLMKSEHVVISSMLSAISSDGAKKGLIAETVGSRMSSEDLPIYKWLSGETEAFVKLRNVLAHSLWIGNALDPNTVTVVHPKFMMDNVGIEEALFAAFKAQPKDQKWPVTIQFHRPKGGVRENAEIFDRDELTALLEKGLNLHAQWSFFHILIAHWLAPEVESQWREHLLSQIPKRPLKSQPRSRGKTPRPPSR